MSFLESALKLADMGFHVFPLEVNGKLPIIDDFPNRATKDEAQIRKWWTDPVMGIEKPYNIGISTTHYNCSQALVVVDVDNKNGKHGSDEVLKLELEGFEFGPTFTQSTPTGGKHIVYKAQGPVKQGVSVLGKGLDIRSKGGYIVGWGSKIDGVLYKAYQGCTDINDCPQWIINACSRVVEREEKHVKIEDINLQRAIMRAGHYLEKEAPIAIEGDGGDITTFKVAAKLKDLGVDKITAYELMADMWNDRCEPPWDPSELERKIENAFGYGSRAQGADAPEATFSPIEKEEKKQDKHFLQTMNEKYALIFGDGNHTILHETVDEKGRPRRVFMSEVSFKRKFSPKTVQQEKSKPKTWAEIWLDWDKRRQYRGVCFRPELEPRNNYYNLWRGFTCKPTPYKDGSKNARLGFDLFMDHALKNVCDNNQELFTWLMGYFAHMIQKPYERPLTTLVFRGSKGVGKNALIDRVGNLLGSGHYLVAHDSRYLTSNFNGHLDSALCLVLDEAFWSGDKSAEGKLKGITTSPEILIERKNREPYSVDNLVRLVVIGNEDWLVPASGDERRYAVFDVGEGKKQNREFFSKMKDLIDYKGGNELLLDYFKTFDLSKIDVNGAPTTKGLLDQKLSSLGLIEEFWYQCLIEERLVEADFVEGWPKELGKKTLRDAFFRFCKKKNTKSRIPSDIAIGRKLVQLCPPLSKRTLKVKDGDEYINGYDLPPIETVRSLMEDYLGQKVNWY